MAMFLRGEFLGFSEREVVKKSNGEVFKILEAGVSIERQDKFGSLVKTTQYLQCAKAIKDNKDLMKKWEAVKGKHINAPVIDQINVYTGRDGTPRYDQKWTIFGEPELIK